MIEIVFKYFWVALLIIVWLIWGYLSIIDIISCLKNKYHASLDDFFFDLEQYSVQWVGLTVGVSALASFIFWITKL